MNNTFHSSPIAQCGTAAIVEDDPALCQQIDEVMQLGGWQSQRFSRGEDFLRRQRGRPFDVIVLDLRLPDLCGFQVLERLASLAAGQDTIPSASIVLTGLMDESALEKAFSLGAADYVLKPFRARELLARLGAAQRQRLGQAARNRNESAVKDASGVAAPLQWGCFEIDDGLRTMKQRGQLVPLTEKEFQTARLLFSRLGQIVSRDELCSRIWPARQTVLSRTIDTHVSRVRTKLGLTDTTEYRLVSVYGQGYRLERLRRQS